MTRRLFIAFLVLATGVLLLHDWLRFGETVRAERQAAVIGLERQAFRLALHAQDDLEPTEEPTQLVNESAHRIARTIARRAGAIAVIADTDGDLVELHPHSTGPALRALARQQAGLVLADDRPRAEVVKSGGTDYEVVGVPVTANRGTVGTVVMIQRSEVLARSERDRLGFITPTLLIAVLVSALGAWVFARLLTRPIGQLVAATRRVARDGAAAPTVEPRGTRETRELAEAFNAMSLRVRDLVDRQRGFASDVSHQLRTPVTTVGVALDNVDAKLRDGDVAGARERLGLARGELDRMHHLVEGLLVLTRVSLSDAPRDDVDLAAIVRDRVATWSALAAEHGVGLLAAADGEHRVLAVPGALDQVIDNLVDNALSVAPAGTEVVVGVESRPGAEILTVRDHGPGMCDAARARAFDRFWRGPEADADGLGLGLTIVHDLVHACRGEVTLESPPDGGLRVTVSLEPVAGGADDPDGHGGGRRSGLSGRVADYLREREPARAAAIAAAVEHEIAADPGATAGSGIDGAVSAFVAVRAHLDAIDPATDAALLARVGGLDDAQIAAVLGVGRREAKSLVRRGRRGSSRRDTAVKAGALAFGVVVAGGGTAAATGSLPAPLQREVARTLDVVGVSVPAPAEAPGRTAPPAHSNPDGSTAGGRAAAAIDGREPETRAVGPMVDPTTTPPSAPPARRSAGNGNGNAGSNGSTGTGSAAPEGAGPAGGNGVGGVGPSGDPPGLGGIPPGNPGNGNGTAGTPPDRAARDAENDPADAPGRDEGDTPPGQAEE